MEDHGQLPPEPRKRVHQEVEQTKKRSGWPATWTLTALGIACRSHHRWLKEEAWAKVRPAETLRPVPLYEVFSEERPPVEPPRRLEYPINARGTGRHHVVVEHHEGQPTVALQGMAVVAIDDGPSLSVLQPPVPGDSGTVLQTEVLAARTLLLDPHIGKPALALVNVRVLGVLEVYAEKIRAALTRRDPAIRDFFDIHHAVQRLLFDPRSQSLLEVVGKKLAVKGTDPVDLSPEKRSALQGQIETQLRPVLRDKDYETFDLPSVFTVLEEVPRLCSS